MTFRVLTGGQTGVDRGALDAAMELELPVGGLAPRGFKAEDGRIPEPYRGLLEESTTWLYSDRTRQLVRRADLVVVITSARLHTPGTRLTVDLARSISRPCLVVTLDEDDAQEGFWRRGVGEWIATFVATAARGRGHEGIPELLVAGPRASLWPEAQRRACATCAAAFRDALEILTTATTS